MTLLAPFRGPSASAAPNALTIMFLGGVGTVTGSKYLLESGTRRLLVDCGLFQGFKQLRLRNWSPLAVPASSIDAVVLTHAHIDHSGYLPLLVKNGFTGPVYCTPATRDLCAILLPDSGHLQEKDADYANRHGFSKHHPALPLYTKEDAERAVTRLTPIDFDRPFDLGKQLMVTPRPAGHILGAAILEFEIAGTKVVFSGDLGRPNSPTMLSPAAVTAADYLIVESTYGDRRHERESAEDALAKIIVRTVGRGGTLLIAAFAVGRAQTLLFLLNRLRTQNRIPPVPIFLDSPMAIDASNVYCAHLRYQRLSAAECRAACEVARYVQDVEASKALDDDPLPKIIVSASGMATGGRILYHLKSYAPDHRNAVLFSGFQAGGTRGAAMLAGVDRIKIHGAYVPVLAEIANLSMLSAHADAQELMEWLGHFRQPPRMTFITHGEPGASDSLRRSIEERFHWPCLVPAYGDQVTLPAATAAILAN